MENEQIIQSLRTCVSLMELHDENSFKVKALQSAVFALEKTDQKLAELSLEELEKIDGLGKSVAAKINEINTKGSLSELVDLVKKTPPGVIEMLNIKGIGPKKVRKIWQELDVTDKESLLKACNEDKVSKLKGFGQKTQESIKQSLLYAEEHKDKFMYMEVEAVAEGLEKMLREDFPDASISLAGEIRRRMEVVEVIQIIAGVDNPIEFTNRLDSLPVLSKDEDTSAPFAWRGNEVTAGAKVEIKMYSKSEFPKKLYLNSLNPDHLKCEAKDGFSIGQYLKKADFVTEEDFYKELGLQYIVPEMREGMQEVDKARKGEIPELLEDKDLKGILHNHCTYSDGTHSLEQMASYCKELGYEYLGISDHSKSAFYANGLYENRVADQQKEIDELNKKLAPFKIFKGIESDILNDGALDYSDDVLKSFDFIVASVHSNLKMNIEKATQRLLTAIENPFTTILGHATGRLLLKREGYPIDYKKVIDACADNKVAIEINANPRRLDMDWRWVIYALEKEIMISVNPDAHSMQEYHNMKYGVLMGRKAGLSAAKTLNALSLSEIEKYFKAKKEAAIQSV